jgi:hypothetical protein
VRRKGIAIVVAGRNIGRVYKVHQLVETDQMARPKKPPTHKSLNPPNPTGKGGIHERPRDAAKAVPARLEKLEEQKAQKAILFREHQDKLKSNMLDIAYNAMQESVRAKATQVILDYVAQGNQDGILEKSDIDEWGTKDEKHQELIDNYLKVVEENKELKRRLAQLEKNTYVDLL